jgi:hypothetical protein
MASEGVPDAAATAGKQIAPAEMLDAVFRALVTALSPAETRRRPRLPVTTGPLTCRRCWRLVRWRCCWECRGTPLTG